MSKNPKQSRDKLKSLLLKNAVQKIRNGGRCGCSKPKPNIQNPR
jgi:hypothetical protein